MLAAVPSGWRNNPAVDQVVELALGETPVDVRYRLGRGGHLSVDGEPLDAVVVDADRDGVVLEVDGVRRRFPVGRDGDHRHVDADDGHVTFRLLPRHPDPTAELAAGSLTAPMPGNVLRVLVAAATRSSPGNRSSSSRR